MALLAQMALVPAALGAQDGIPDLNGIPDLKGISQADLQAALHNTTEGKLPKSWYTLPEDGGAAAVREQKGGPAMDSIIPADVQSATANVAPAMNRLLESNIQALDQLSSDPVPGNATPGFVPWRLDYFTTDLQLTLSGLLGAVTVQGQPLMVAIFKKQGQNPAMPAPSAPSLSAETASMPLLTIREDESAADLGVALEPVIRASMATGKIQNESVFRQSLHEQASQFQETAQALSATPGNTWWASRLRLDVVVAASGRVAAMPLATVGGEVRLRFEWSRMVVGARRGIAPAAIRPLSARGVKLQQFVLAMQKAAGEALGGTESEGGLRVYQIRVGVGVTVAGTIGVAKGSAQVLGCIYFSKAVPKPTVYPSNALEIAQGNPPVQPAKDEILLLDGDVPASHLAYAKASNTRYRMDSPVDAVFPIALQRVRQGLKDALKMGHLMGVQGKRSAPGKWNLYEIRPEFDLSIGGSLKLVTVTGVALIEIDIYNENF